jgi:hypothetical protein
MNHCVRIHNGKFHFQETWKKTFFYPYQKCPTKMFQQIHPSIQNFQSDFLYRRWLRCHMDLSQFILNDQQNVFIKKMDIKQLTFQSFYE